MKIRTHPLTKAQSILVILWFMSLLFAYNLNRQPARLAIFAMVITFVFLGINTIWIGWLMAVRNELVLYPIDSLVFKLIRDNNARDRRYASFLSPWRQKGIGLLNIVSGGLCLIVGIFFMFIV